MVKQDNINRMVFIVFVVILLFIPSVTAINNYSNLEFDSSARSNIGVLGGFRKIRLFIVNDGDEVIDGYCEVSISSSFSNHSFYLNESFSVSAGKFKFIPVRVGWFLRGKVFVYITADGLVSDRILYGNMFLGFVRFIYGNI